MALGLDNKRVVASCPTPSLMLGLPSNYLTSFRPRLKQLQQTAEQIFESLKENPDGNQWLVLFGLTPATIQRLDTDQSILGVDYRFQWEDTTGLLKIVHSHAHNITTDQIIRSIDDRLSTMGIRFVHRTWGATSTHKPTTAKGKQGDQIFLPPSRCPSPGQPAGWPTFAIETGVSESLPRLREDAKWWLHASDGAVRIVLVVGIRRSCVTFEKWQLAPPNAPRPLTRQYIDSLRSQGSPRPILALQLGPTQQPYSAREVEVVSELDSKGIHGAPMIFEFDALYDNSAGPGQTDVILDRQDFADITSMLL